MTINPFKPLTKPIPLGTWLLFTMMTLYVIFSLLLFFQWVDPSLDGRSDKHIAADSTTYLYFADSLRGGQADPYVIEALSSFPNTLWFPVLLALLLQSTFAMVVANYVMFFLALSLIRRSLPISTGGFVALLLVNATTTISLLSVNKEIVDFLAISIFLFGLRRSRNAFILFALFFALLNRFEVCLVMVVYLLAMGKLNPLRRRRALTLVSLVIALSILLPLATGANLAYRFEEARSGGAIALLDSLEMHYMYGIAVIPKIGENLFGELMNFSKWEKSYGDLSNVANSYILLSNNLATALVVIILIKRHTLSLRSDLVYFSMLACTIMAVSLVIQPRYFYFAYVLLCLQASQEGEPSTALSLNSYPEIRNA
jgi:hypothetical protein